jgi:hypothetical protein
MKNCIVLYACCAALAGAQAAEVRKAIPDVLPPDVIAAVSNVFVVAHLVSRGREFCGGKYAVSAQSWHQRNSSVLQQKDRVMAHGDQALVASALVTDARRKTDGMLLPLQKASNAERSKWCSQAFADVDRGTLDLVGRASIAPLMALSR